MPSTLIGDHHPELITDDPRRSEKELDPATVIQRDLKRGIAKHGDIIPAGLASHLLGVTNSRIHQLFDAGQLTRVPVFGHSYAPLSEVLQRKKLADSGKLGRGGRPRKAKKAG